MTIHFSRVSRRSFQRALLLPALMLAACVPSVPIAPSVQPVPKSGTQWLVEPGDVLRLRVFRETDLSGDLSVNERGQVVIPTIGRRTVTGLTPAQVENTVLQSFAGRLDSTRIEVTFLRPLSVLGGVKSPGVQLADPSASVLSLVSHAGGPIRPGGDLRVFLLRIGEPVHEISTADRVSDLGLRSTDELYVQDPPFVVRNEVAIRSVFQALELVTSILTIVLLTRNR